MDDVSFAFSSPFFGCWMESGYGSARRGESERNRQRVCVKYVVIKSLANVCDVELNWLVCKATTGNNYDLYLQLGSDTPSGRSCSNYQTIHLPCLC